MSGIANADVSAIDIAAWRVGLAAIGFPDGTGPDTLTHKHIADAAYSSREEVQNLYGVLVELATDVGSEALLNAAHELAFSTEAWRGMPPAERAAQVFAAAFKGDGVAAAVILCARNMYAEHGRPRSRVEFRAREHPPMTKAATGAAALQRELPFLLNAEDFGSHVELEYFEDNGFFRVFVSRGGRVVKPLTIDESADTTARRFLRFRPATCDQLIFDEAEHILRVVASPARVATRYAQLFGKAFFDDEGLFTSTETCSLDALRHGADPPAPSLNLAVDRVDLLACSLVHENLRISVRGSASGVLKKFPDAHMIDAKLRLHFRQGPAVVVKLRPPNRVEFVQDSRADQVERYLVQAGFRRPSAQRSDLWSLPSLAAPIGLWRSVLGRSVDALRVAGVLESCALSAVGADGDRRRVEKLADAEYVGLPTEADVGLRVLTPSDIDGLRLDVDRFGGHVQQAIAAGGPVTHLAGGAVLRVGTRTFGQTQACLYVAVREPQRDLLAADFKASAETGIRVVLLPRGRALDLGVREVSIDDWTDSQALNGAVVDGLGLRSSLPFSEQVPPNTRLALHPDGTVIVDAKEVEFDPDGQPFKLLMALAQAHPALVATKELDRILSANRNTDNTTRQAKSGLKKKLGEAGVPKDTVDDMFNAKTGSLGLAFAPYLAPSGVAGA